MRFHSIALLASAAFGTALVCATPASADVIIPSAVCGTVPGTNCLQFDAFTVYSLALLNFQAGAGTIGPNDPFAVSTNGISLQNALVVGTGIGGAGSLNSDLVAGGNADDAYNTPSAAGGGLTNFVPNAGNQGLQGGAIPGNTSGTWDINISALQTYLNGGNLNFFFNLNQTNSRTTTYLNDPEDALGWMKVTLTDTKTANGSVSFWLDGNACTGVVGAPNSPNCDPTQSYPQNNANNTILPIDPLHDEWAYIHGQICVSPAGGVVNFGACAKGDHVDTTVNQNLGANDAAFALYSDTLQTALNSGMYDVLSVDFRMAALDNGYEQLLIFAGNSIPTDVPEPLTITVFGAGLAGVALWRRRRKD
jgi:hypothetical protein